MNSQHQQNFAAPIRWGILGCGDVCEVKSGPGFQKATGSELVAVMRREGEKARDFARRHAVPKWYDDADHLIQDPEVDAVYIATPPGGHRDLALAVAAAGKPCYVEKPMARNQAECREMIEAFAGIGRPLFVAYYRRCLPRFGAVHELLRNAAIGRLTAIEYRFANSAYRQVDSQNLPWRLRPELSGGGLLLDLGSHLIDLLDHLLGPLQEVEGESRNRSGCLPVADQTDLIFQTVEGVAGKAHWDFASEEVRDGLILSGERGRIELSCFGNEALRLEIDGAVEYRDYPNPPHVQQPLIQTMVDELSGSGSLCPSTGVSAARASAIMDRVSG